MTNVSTVIQTPQNPIPPDFTLLLNMLSDKIKKSINCARPGVIKAVYDGNTADIQISQQQVTSTQPDGTQTFSQFAPLNNVPIWTLGGGGVTATFPIKSGDECIVLFCDREIDNWYLTGTIAAPTTPRLHDFSDAICLVGLRSVPRTLSSISSTDAQIRSDDGSTSIGLNPTTKVITLLSSVQVVLNAPLVTVIGNMNVEGNSGATPTTFDSDLIQTPGKVLSAGNGVTGSGTHVTVLNGIVTAVS